MAGSGKRGGDRVLESRHLVGLFLGVVLLCGVFFTLGYVMGKTQYGGAVHAASSPGLGGAVSRGTRKSASAATPDAASPAPNASEWDFYGKKQDDDDHLQSPAKNSSPWPTSPPAAAAPVATPAPERSVREVPAGGRFRTPRLVRGAIVLQVAALRHQGDALAMAEMLQKKRFPSFVVSPTTDRFYRVQVGPYRNERAAQTARSALERAGFKAIIKR
jgi:DedD protein